MWWAGNCMELRFLMPKYACRGDLMDIASGENGFRRELYISNRQISRFYNWKRYKSAYKWKDWCVADLSSNSFWRNSFMGIFGWDVYILCWFIRASREVDVWNSWGKANSWIASRICYIWRKTNGKNRFIKCLFCKYRKGYNQLQSKSIKNKQLETVL